MSDAKEFWNSKGLVDLGNWTAVPNFFSNDLMILGQGISPQFWKFTSLAWRNWLAPVMVSGGAWEPSFRFTFRKEQLREEFGIHNDAIAMCMSAYRVCGFCKLEKGRRHNFKEPGIPSTLTYVNTTRLDDWKAFIAALKSQTKTDKTHKWASGDDAYCVALAWKVVEVRTQLKRSSAHMDLFFQKMRTAGVILPPDSDHSTEYVLRKSVTARERASY